jgi:hypothetical protein
MRAASLFLTLLLPVAASAEIVDIKWTDGTFAHKTSIAPTKFLEVCGKQKTGDVVQWKFIGNAPADFNIHYHVGKDVSYPENRKAVASAEGSLVAPLDQDFCWMWTNKSAQVLALDVKLQQVKAGK